MFLFEKFHKSNSCSCKIQILLTPPLVILDQAFLILCQSLSPPVLYKCHYHLSRFVTNSILRLSFSFWWFIYYQRPLPTKRRKTDKLIYHQITAWAEYCSPWLWSGSWTARCSLEAPGRFIVFFRCTFPFSILKRKRVAATQVLLSYFLFKHLHELSQPSQK